MKNIYGCQAHLLSFTKRKKNEAISVIEAGFKAQLIIFEPKSVFLGKKRFETSKKIWISWFQENCPKTVSET